jgi:signal transduction histidine kinase
VDSKRRGRLALLLSSFFGLALVLGFVWAMVLGESRSRLLNLQFEVYRASADLVELWLDDPGTSLVGGPVVGFGIYDGQGRSLSAQGSAPTRLAEAPRLMTLKEGPKGASVLLVRPLSSGLLGLRRPGGPGTPGMMGPGRMMGPPGGDPPAPRFGPGRLGDAASTGARTIWLEYALAGNETGRLLLIGGGALLSLVFVALYILLLLLFRKNSELREREIRNRELAELGEAARTLVHEIKNPLAIIGVQAGTLRRREGEDSPSGKTALVIEGEVRRLARMADRIREFLKSGSSEQETIDLAVFLADFAARYAESADGEEGSPRLALSSGVEGGALARIDRDRLSLALDNLVRNAYEADPSGRVEIALSRQGRSWAVAVSDRGPGIPASDQSRLFEPFFTTKEKGSGIGLALARSIARGARGELIWEPRHGGGSVFTFTLPAGR